MFRTAVVAGVAAMVVGCGNGGSAVETRERTAGGAEAVLTAATAAPARAETSATEAQPALTANRRETADAKAVRLFERNGADFGARSPEEYVEKVQAFTRRPPADAEKVERANGDVLLYQASTNTFAVVSGEGVPKTMFKPDDGVAYWAEQKARAPEFGGRSRD